MHESALQFNAYIFLPLNLVVLIPSSLFGRSHYTYRFSASQTQVRLQVEIQVQFLRGGEACSKLRWHQQSITFPKIPRWMLKPDSTGSWTWIRPEFMMLKNNVMNITCRIMNVIQKTKFTNEKIQTKALLSRNVFIQHAILPYYTSIHFEWLQSKWGLSGCVGFVEVWWIEPMGEI